MDSHQFEAVNGAPHNRRTRLAREAFVKIIFPGALSSLIYSRSIFVIGLLYK